jgi:hypothetical protein
MVGKARYRLFLGLASFAVVCCFLYIFIQGLYVIHSLSLLPNCVVLFRSKVTTKSSVFYIMVTKIYFLIYMQASTLMVHALSSIMLISIDF